MKGSEAYLERLAESQCQQRGRKKETNLDLVEIWRFGLGLMAQKIEKKKKKVGDDKTCDGYQSCGFDEAENIARGLRRRRIALSVTGSGQDDENEKSEWRGWVSVKTSLREREVGEGIACLLRSGEAKRLWFSRWLRGEVNGEVWCCLRRAREEERK